MRLIALFRWILVVVVLMVLGICCASCLKNNDHLPLVSSFLVVVCFYIVCLVLGIGSTSCFKNNDHSPLVSSFLAVVCFYVVYFLLLANRVY
jgi:nitrate/nitrite transporter NarK